MSTRKGKYSFSNVYSIDESEYMREYNKINHDDIIRKKVDYNRKRRAQKKLEKMGLILQEVDLQSIDFTIDEIQLLLEYFHDKLSSSQIDYLENKLFTNKS